MTAPSRIHAWLADRPADAAVLQLLTLSIGEDPSLVQEWLATEILPSPELAFEAATRVLDIAQAECDAQQVRCKFAVRWVAADGRPRGQTVIKCSPREHMQEDGSADPEPTKTGIVEQVLRHKENDHRQTHVAWMGVAQQNREHVGELRAQNAALFAALVKRDELFMSIVGMVKELLDEKRQRQALDGGAPSAKDEAVALAITELAGGAREHLLPAIAAPLAKLVENAGAALAVRPGKPNGKPPAKPNGANGHGKPGAGGNGVGN